MRTARRFIASLLAACLIFGLSSASALAADVMDEPTDFAPLPVGRFVFPDTADHWGRSEVEAAAGLGLFSGYDDGFFRPDRTITRAEFIKIAATGLALPDGSVEALAFADAAAIRSSVFAPFIAAAAAQGLVRPADFTDGRLDPDRPITRAEIARILARGLAAEPLPESSAWPQLSDIPGDELGNEIRATVRRGIVNGYPDGTFQPERTATRAEAAAMLLRAMRGRAAQGPHAVAGSAAEVAFPVHQFVLAGVYGYADEADGGVAVMSQWATPATIDEFRRLLAELGEGATRFATPYISDQPTWIGRDAAVAGADLSLTRLRNGKWEGRRVGFDFYLRFTENRWEITGMGITPNYGDPRWEEMRTGKPPHLLLFRVEDPMFGKVYTVARPDQQYDGEVVGDHFKAFHATRSVEILTIDGVPWEQSVSAQLVRPFLNRHYDHADTQFVMYIFDASIDRLTARSMTRDELAGLLWNSFYYRGQSLPLAVNGVPWSRLWREPLVRDLAAKPRDQVTSELHRLSQQLYELLDERR